MSESLQTILDAQYLGDLTALDTDALRSRRASCQQVETGLSYLRRLAQGRLDVVVTARRVHADPGTRDELDEMLDRLPGVLAGSTRAPGNGRLPSEFGMGAVDAALEAELDDIVGNGHLSGIGELDDAALEEAIEQLTAYERKVSDLRRQIFDRLDVIEAELTRRYRTGEASVDSLLG